MTLENKQFQIEGVINDHLKFLHGKNCLSQFASLEFMQKIEYLSYHDFHIKNGPNLSSSKDEFERELTSDRLRLEGVTLSYDLYESITFSKIKEIQKIMDRKSSHFKENYTLDDE
jgi:hypothetical protein